MSRAVLRYLVTVVALAMALTLLSLAALLLQPRGSVSLVYPATGMGAAVLWGFGARWWPAVVICQFITSYRATGSAPVAILVTGIELLVITLFCGAMARFRVSRNLERVRDLAIFVAAAVVSATAGGIPTIIGEWLVETRVPDKLLFDGLSFALSDAVSLLIFVPLVLGWRRWPFPSLLVFRRWLLMSLLLVAIGIAIAVFGEPASSTLFLLLPIVIFSAIVGGVPGVAASGAILLVILLGIGSKQHPRHFNDVIHVIFVGTATATGYVLAVLWSEREQSARRLFQLAHRDPLTGMDNRYELETRLREAVALGPPLAHALLYLDLDQFKLVNDTSGHMAGDRMLQELAAHLRGPVPARARADAAASRMAGEEWKSARWERNQWSSASAPDSGKTHRSRGTPAASAAAAEHRMAAAPWSTWRFAVRSLV